VNNFVAKIDPVVAIAYMESKGQTNVLCHRKDQGFNELSCEPVTNFMLTKDES
jgi:hypothetical protein